MQFTDNHTHIPNYIYVFSVNTIVNAIYNKYCTYFSFSFTVDTALNALDFIWYKQYAISNTGNSA